MSRNQQTGGRGGIRDFDAKCYGVKEISAEGGEAKLKDGYIDYGKMNGYARKPAREGDMVDSCWSWPNPSTHNSQRDHS